MCFIAGIVAGERRYISGEELREFFRVIGAITFLRGRDSGGIVLDTVSGTFSKKVSFHKKDEELEPPACVDILVKAAFMQTRAVPESEYLGVEGGISLENTQPFDTESWITLHNGSISNDQELRSELLVDPQTPSVDSAILPTLFTKFPVLDGLKKLKGSFAIAAYRKYGRQLYLAKNFQPLYYGRANNLLYFSSLPTPLTCLELPAYSLLTFSGRGKVTLDSLYPDRVSNRIVVCLSSGLDSAVTLRLYQVLGYEVQALFFDYGQYAIKSEEYCSRKLCEKLEIPWCKQVLDLSSFTSPLLSGKKYVVESLKDAETTFSYVPQRNLILISYALAYAEQLEYDFVTLGMNLSDAGAYPDNGLPFLYKLNEITPYSSNWNTQLKVVAPFVNLMKSEIVTIGLKIGVPFKYICSCYYPELSGEFPKYCGECGSDVYYRYAWKRLGYRPPNLGFEYEEGELPPQGDVSPSLRLDLSEIPYAEVIRFSL